MRSLPSLHRAAGALWLLSGCSDYSFSGKTEPAPGPVDDTGPAPDGDDPGPPVDTAPPEDTAPPPPPSCAEFAPPPPPSPAPDGACLRPPAVGSLDPVIEWNSELDLGYTTRPEVRHPYVTPVVGQLTDDNDDGNIDENDTPDIAFTVFEGGSGPGSGLRVISGDGTVDHLFIAAASFAGRTWPIARQGGVAIADLEGDGSPDIISIVMVEGDSVSARVAAFERDGTTKWVETTAETSRYSYPSVADLDGDGQAEVVVGNILIDTNGALIAVGAGGTGTPDDRPSPTWGSISIPVDLQVDGSVEVVAGNTVYSATGAIVATSGLPDGFTAVGDLDGDGVAEIVTTVHSTGEVYAWRGDGAVIWRTATGSGGGGPPTVADFDADGAPEIGVAGRSAYTVLETDGSVRWTAPITDISSAATGSSVYDFDGDGAYEVVFADEETFWIFDGATGAVLFRDDGHKHGTAWEYPVVADVDGDGQVEIALGSVATDGQWNGVTVIGSASGSWTPARPVWNQHAYHITNIGDECAVPTVAAPNWRVWNNFRAAAPESGPATDLPNLVGADPAICLDTCGLGEITLYLRQQNVGLIEADVVDVILEDELGAERGRFTLPRLPSGGGAVLGPLTLAGADWGPGRLFARVDPDDRLLECDEDDNLQDLGPWPCPGS